MKFGFRIPSITKRIAARTSVKRIIRHNLGLKAPRGMGWITNPKRAMYNRVYNRTSRGCMLTLIWLMGIPLLLIAMALFFSACAGNDRGSKSVYVKPSIDYKGKFRKGFLLFIIQLCPHCGHNSYIGIFNALFLQYQF
ncbi:MAG: hypothetical protein RL642_808 [Bacteroidota bacterium]|jgi:hypothetical protein